MASKPKMKGIFKGFKYISQIFGLYFFNQSFVN